MAFKLPPQAVLMLGLVAIAIPAVSFSAEAAASPTKTLYTFCHEQDCTDGAQPSGNLLIDGQRNLYGTTTNGGQNNSGTIFEIFQNTATGAHRHKVLYDFCNKTGCADGANPIDGSLIVDTAGSLYGTTSVGGTTGGPNGGGVVFKLTPNANKTHWTYSVLYNFCQLASCSDGITPIGNLTYFGAETGAAYDKTSRLYGTAMQGGKHNNGLVFSLTLKKDGTFRETPIYYFCSAGGSTCSDGRSPTGGLTMDPNSNLAGTTAIGGINDAGVAFKLTSVGKVLWSESVLHQFCSNEGCSDGMSPQSGLVADSSGNFYGTTISGGNNNHNCSDTGCGVAFKIDSHNLMTILYTFCALDKCADGGVPARLSLDLSDNPIGLTTIGGANHAGTLYRLEDGFQDLFNFKCTDTKCINGKSPAGGVLMDLDNAIYGVMGEGGAEGAGTAIKYLPAD